MKGGGRSLAPLQSLLATTSQVGGCLNHHISKQDQVADCQTETGDSMGKVFAIAKVKPKLGKNLAILTIYSAVFLNQPRKERVPFFPLGSKD